MFPIKALVLAALPGLMVFGAEAGEPLSDENPAVVLVADTSRDDRRDARSRLGRRPLPEHDRQSVGRVGGKFVRLPSDFRPLRDYERRPTLGERRYPRAEHHYERRTYGYERDRNRDRYDPRREERGPIEQDLRRRDFRERDRLNVEAQRKVSRGPA